MYDKPLITAETFVFYGDEDGMGNYKMTPEIYRQQADKMILCGVNEMIYSGFPYVYNDEAGNYGQQNWSGFCSKYSGYDIATTFSESDTFWPYMKELNNYVSRIQYLMKQGKPSSDVLVYLPKFAYLPWSDYEKSEQFSIVTETLDSNGIAWTWINEELLESAEYKDKIIVNGKIFDAVIIPKVDSMELSTAQALKRLAKAGAPIVYFGVAPSMQPTFCGGDYLKLDVEVKTISEEIAALKNCIVAEDENSLSDFLDKYIDPEISYEYNSNLDFIRRDYGDMGHLIFIRNNDHQPSNYNLKFSNYMKNAYIFDAYTGTVHRIEVTGGALTGSLDAKQSVVILFSDSELLEEEMLEQGNPLKKAAVSEKIFINNWTLQVSGQDINNYVSENGLGLWRDNEDLMYCADQGLYGSNFFIDSRENGKNFLLKLGSLYGVPEVSVNGSKFVALPLAPYEMDITNLIAEGENTIEVKLTVALRNRLIGYALNGEDGRGRNSENYSQFITGKPVKTGMVGGSVIEIR